MEHKAAIFNDRRVQILRGSYVELRLVAGAVAQHLVQLVRRIRINQRPKVRRAILKVDMKQSALEAGT